MRRIAVLLASIALVLVGCSPVAEAAEPVAAPAAASEITAATNWSMMVPDRSAGTATLAADLACPLAYTTSHIIRVAGNVEGVVWTEWVHCGSYLRLQYLTVSLDTNEIRSLYGFDASTPSMKYRHHSWGAQFQQVQGQSNWYNGNRWWLGGKAGYFPVSQTIAVRVDNVGGVDFNFTQNLALSTAASESS